MKTLLLATALALAPVTALPALAATDAATTTAPAPAQPRAKMMFWFLDRNGDGVIDVSEITAYRTARFNALDANGDGKLTRDEVLAAWTPAPWKHHGRKGETADAGPAKGPAAGGPADARKERVAERIAKRQGKMLERMGFKDGVTEITLADFLKQPTPLFAKADPDGTGKITEAAFLAVFTKGPGKGPGQWGHGPAGDHGPDGDHGPADGNAPAAN